MGTNVTFSRSDHQADGDSSRDLGQLLFSTAVVITDNHSVYQDDAVNNASAEIEGTTMTIMENQFLVPLWIVAVYGVLLTAGALLNLVHFLTLVRCSRSGTLSLIMQLALVDVLSFDVSMKEILALRSRSWTFSSELCPFFMGTETFANSLIAYLLICLNFHVISLWNLLEWNTNNPLTSTAVNLRDSNECLVTRNEHYRKRKTDISVVFPSMFVWFVALSLSIPNMTLSSTLTIGQNFTLCSVIDYDNQILQYLQLAFKIVTPACLLIVSLSALLAILFFGRNQNVFDKNYCETKALVRFAIVLSLVYGSCSIQRHVFQSLHIITYNFGGSTVTDFKMPPLYNNYLTNDSLVYLGMLHYVCGGMRALVCILVLPKFRFLVKTKTFCWHNK